VLRFSSLLRFARGLDGGSSFGALCEDLGLECLLLLLFGLLLGNELLFLTLLGQLLFLGDFLSLLFLGNLLLLDTLFVLLLLLLLLLGGPLLGSTLLDALFLGRDLLHGDLMHPVEFGPADIERHHLDGWLAKQLFARLSARLASAAV